MREYMEIEKRLHILDQRLEVIKDLYEMLQNELNAKHSASLEWIVIWLIFIPAERAFFMRPCQFRFCASME